MSVTKMVCTDCEISLEAQFDLSPLASLTPDEQSFVCAFVHAHGSIKQVGRIFGISYPTIKNRLTAIARKLPNGGMPEGSQGARDLRSEVIERLKNKEISPKEALDLLGR